MFNRIINDVKNTKFDVNSKLTLAESIDLHKGLSNIKWEKHRDGTKGNYVKLTADVEDVKTFYTPYMYDTKDYIDTKSLLINTLFEMVEYKEYMEFYNNAEEILDYLNTRKGFNDKNSLLEFDIINSEIKIYIEFVKNSDREIVPISSGFSLNLKVSRPDLGYFGGVFDDMADGKKCLSVINRGEPVTLFNSF